MMGGRVVRVIATACAVLLLTAAAASAKPNKHRRVEHARVEHARVYVQVGPPAPRFERRVIAPRPNLVWVEGYYRRHGNRYEWVPGYWIEPPRPRAVWVPGRWEREPRGWFFSAGFWR
ncbi:MAG TPA: hypothetical protein VL173_04145 [Vicinamibacterales bacterium]|nr:hypothetical protein [Vicinamibacterales bacterium]